MQEIEKKGYGYFKNLVAKTKESSENDDDYKMLLDLYRDWKEMDFEKYMFMLIEHLRENNCRL